MDFRNVCGDIMSYYKDTMLSPTLVARDFAYRHLVTIKQSTYTRITAYDRHGLVCQKHRHGRIRSSRVLIN